MANFFRSFLASLLALVVFTGMLLLVGMIVVAVLASGKEIRTGGNAVLVVDLSHHYPEVEPVDLAAILSGGEGSKVIALYDLVRMIRHAAGDADMKGIYLKCHRNANGLASSGEIRAALEEFRKSGKFVYAYGEVISQTGYYVATAADRVYCHPHGGLEWLGFSMQMPFVTGTLEKLGIEPQIFYAGKFKSATEPFREKQMTEANRLQSTMLLNGMYAEFLKVISRARNKDTGTLHRYADSNAVQFAAGALQYGMIDGLRHDDEVKNEIRKALGSKDESASINFIYPGRYAQAVNFRKTGASKIALIYAEGDIVEGSGERNFIGGDTYRNYVRRARLDGSVKAIVLRINSGGGSAMASEVIWREVELARKVKPVIVSLGDVAASGGYYMACAADSIFTQPNTITGSIGVFGLLPNMQPFFNDRLGITFDGVETSPHAAMMSVTKPLTAPQKKFIQDGIDSIYVQFKSRVSAGRKRSMEYIDSIAQGRVWSGAMAVELGLADRLGGIDDAINAAAARVGTEDYRLVEYPERKNVIEMIFEKKDNAVAAEIRKELGPQMHETYRNLARLKRMAATPQARMPFEVIIE